MYFNVKELHNQQSLIYADLHSLFNDKSSTFPCAFAISSFNLNCMSIGIYESFYNDLVIRDLAIDLKSFSTYIKRQSRTEHEQRFETFVAIFKDSDITTHEQFENELFAFLQKLHEIDLVDWREDISKNPEDPNFSFCFNGDIWFPVSLTPFHKYSIRSAKYIIIAFQPGLTFEINKQKFSEKFSAMRLSIHKNIDTLYPNGSKPLYLTNASQGLNYVQYIGEDPKLFNELYECPLKIYK